MLHETTYVRIRHCCLYIYKFLHGLVIVCSFILLMPSKTSFVFQRGLVGPINKFCEKL